MNEQQKIEEIFDKMLHALHNETETCECAVPEMLLALAFSVAEAQDCVPYCQKSLMMQEGFENSRAYFDKRNLPQN